MRAAELAIEQGIYPERIYQGLLIDCLVFTRVCYLLLMHLFTDTGSSGSYFVKDTEGVRV